jgi:hypothetical protein
MQKRGECEIQECAGEYGGARKEKAIKGEENRGFRLKAYVIDEKTKDEQ